MIKTFIKDTCILGRSTTYITDAQWCKISDFCCGVVEVSALLQCCVVKVGSLLPMFLNNTGHIFQGPTIWDCLTLEEEPNMFQNTS